MYQLKRNKLTITQSNTKLNMFQMFTPTNMLTIPQLKKDSLNIYHKKEFNKELNIKPSKDKQFTNHKNNK